MQHPPCRKEVPSGGCSWAVVPGSSIENMEPKSVLTCNKQTTQTLEDPLY